jgi:hypothetical protein
MGRRDATPAPTLSIMISTRDTDTDWRDAVMETLLNRRCHKLQLQPAMARAPISTGGAPSSDFNR